jgi:hypothetical protein
VTIAFTLKSSGNRKRAAIKLQQCLCLGRKWPYFNTLLIKWFSVKGAISGSVPNLMSYTNINTVFLSQDDFWEDQQKKKNLNGENLLQGKYKIKFISGSTFVFLPQATVSQYFICKKHKYILSGKLGNTVATPELFITLVVKKN